MSLVNIHLDFHMIRLEDHGEDDTLRRRNRVWTGTQAGQSIVMSKESYHCPTDDCHSIRGLLKLRRNCMGPQILGRS